MNVKTRYDPFRHRRRSIRLKGHDYTQPAAYFVTIRTWDRECLFGGVVEQVVVLSEFGRILAEEWEQTAVLRPYVRLDSFVVMPNHIHGILWIIHTDADSGRGTARRAPTGTEQNPGKVPTHRATAERHFGKPIAGSLPTIIGAFKSAVTKRINRLRKTAGAPIWQRGYYEHIIRADRTLAAIRRYIQENPARWERDADNPHRTEKRCSVP